MVILDNSGCEEKVQHEINTSSFEKNLKTLTKCIKKVNNWLEKWYKNKSISEKWKKNYYGERFNNWEEGNAKTHKIINPIRAITSDCNTAIENLSIVVGNGLYDIAS